MEQRDTVIKVRVEREADLYETFDEDQRTLSGALVSYLGRRHNRRRPGEVPVIRLVCRVPLDEARLKGAMKHTVERMLEDNRLERRRLRFNELYLFAIGLACILAGIALSDLTGVVYLQLLSLTAGFAIKEAANIQFLSLPKLNLERRKLRFLSRGRLEFIYKR